MSTGKVKSLTQVPIDILKHVFEWISGESVDACLLRQINQSLKWILTNQVRWKPVLNPNLPFTQQLDVIARHFPTPTSPSELEQLKVTCLTNGQLKNFEYLHGTDDDMAVVYLTATIANGHLACLKALVKRCSAEFLANAHHLLMSATAIHGVIPIAEFLYSDCHVNIRAGGEAALIRACRHNQPEMVQWLVNRGADFRVNEDEPVFTATAGGHLELVKFFHSLGANVCAVGSFAEACANGHLDVVNYLIDLGVDIHCLNERPMMNAIYRNRLEIVKRLEVAGCNVDARLFKCACQNGRLEIVKYMCSIIGNKHVQNADALELASYGGHLNVVEYLHSMGADIHAKDERIIMSACQGGHVDIVQWLLSKGCDVYYDNDRLLRVACMNGQLDVVKMLCSVQTNIRGREVHAVLLACANNHLEIMKHLYTAGAILDGPSCNSLKAACNQGHLEIVEYLFSLGTNIHVNDDEPLRIACRIGHLSIVKYLISVGANIHVKNDLPLQVACQFGHLNIVLLLHSADEMSSFNNLLPAMASVISGNDELVRYFHALGVNLRHANDISLQRACKYGHVEIVKFLHSIGAQHENERAIALANGRTSLVEYLDFLTLNQE